MIRSGCDGPRTLPGRRRATLVEHIAAVVVIDGSSSVAPASPDSTLLEPTDLQRFAREHRAVDASSMKSPCFPASPVSDRALVSGRCPSISFDLDHLQSSAHVGHVSPGCGAGRPVRTINLRGIRDAEMSQRGVCEVRDGCSRHWCGTLDVAFSLAASWSSRPRTPASPSPAAAARDLPRADS